MFDVRSISGRVYYATSSVTSSEVNDELNLTSNEVNIDLG